MPFTPAARSYVLALWSLCTHILPKEDSFSAYLPPRTTPLVGQRSEHRSAVLAPASSGDDRATAPGTRGPQDGAQKGDDPTDQSQQAAEDRSSRRPGLSLTDHGTDQRPHHQSEDEQELHTDARSSVAPLRGVAVHRLHLQLHLPAEDSLAA